MQIRPKKAAAAHKLVNGQPPQAVPAESFTFPAPIRGWVLNENLATVQPAGARILDNWLCTTTGVKVRGGCIKYATIAASVKAVWAYNAPNPKFFAATTTAVYDITSPASPTVSPAATVSGRTSGDYATVQFGTAGGSYLYAVNGVDKPLLYDGSTFTGIDGVSTPAITGVTTTTLSQVWTFANRLFFIQKDTMNAWYLPVDSIGGAANSFSLAGIFSKGGSLLFGAKWSIDAGDGLDDKCVFVSTEGEVAVYQGTNPGSAADWSLAGIYTMPKPIGKNAYTTAGGDLLIATEVGLIPVSAAIQNDLAALESKAVSGPIATYWQSQSRSLGGGWQIVKAPRKGIMFVSQPDTSGVTKTVLAVNLLTGAWSRITGWDARCMAYYSDNAYFGADDNSIYLMDAGGSDAGAIYTALYLGQHESMGLQGREKTVLQMQAMFQTGTPINPQLSALSDFSEDTSAPPSSPANYTTSAWDSGLWDTATWDETTSTTNDARWTAAGVSGATIAPELQLTFGITPTPVVELVAIDAQFRIGAVVT